MPDTVRLTYVELGNARGISAESAERLARRKRWPRVLTNDGKARVVVPIGDARPAGDIRADRPPGDMSALPAIIEAAVSPLREQLNHERAERQALQARLDELLARGWWRRMLNR